MERRNARISTKSFLFKRLTLFLLALPGTALAAEPADTGNTAWMLVSTALVLMMTIPGVALFYGGMVRKKNLISTGAQVFSITCLVTVLWAAVGYSLVFTPGNAVIGGFGKAFLHGMGYHSRASGLPESVFMMFQMTFAIITPALIVGAFVERMKFSAMLWFVAAWLLLVYAPIAHMVWGGGWLGGLGVLDFAGGTVVHVNAGVAGLIAALVVGPRHGHKRDPMHPTNLIYTMTGAGLLWVGWFGFNAGSALAADDTAGMAMAVTQIAAGTAALTWMFAEWFFRTKPTMLGMASGAVAGLIAITPAAGFVGPSAAFVIGAVAGLICFWAVVYVKRWLGYDDALDAFGVHGVGGIVGALLTGPFAAVALGGTGLADAAEGSLWRQFGIQAVGVGVTLVYTALATFVILKIIDWLLGLRVEHDEELEGLDTTQHGEQIYE